VHQQAKLEWIAATGPRLHRTYRAYLLKEGLRTSATPAPSSSWPCSPSAATGHPCLEDDHE